MTSSRPFAWGLFALTLFASGCATYHYMRDATPDIEKSRRDYVFNNPGNRYNEDIEKGRIRPGMSRLQVRVTWGDPDRITRTDASHEDWAYDENDVSRGYGVYMLRFGGELLTRVDVDHAGVPPSTNAQDKPRTSAEDKAVAPKPGVKPGG